MKRRLLVVALLSLCASCALAADAGKLRVALIADACVGGRKVTGDLTVAEAVSAAGFIPLVLPHLSNTNQIDEILGRADALVLFGKVPGGTGERGPFEKSLIRRAAALGKPILGICNGLQQINAAFGGSIGLVPQDASVKVAHGLKGSTWTNDQFHEIRTEPGSMISWVLGAETYRVNTSHSYCIHRLAKDFRVTARSADGVIEAIEHTRLPIFAFQFHPERMAVRDKDKGADRMIRAALRGLRDPRSGGGARREVFNAK